MLKQAPLSESIEHIMRVQLIPCQAMLLEALDNPPERGTIHVEFTYAKCVKITAYARQRTWLYKGRKLWIEI